MLETWKGLRRADKELTMDRRFYQLFATAAGLALLALTAGCSATTVSYAVPVGPGEKIIAIEASSFAFSPNRITVPAGSKLQLMVKNSAGMDHNLTVEDTAGKHLLELALPAGETATGSLTLEQKGEYRIYCDKPLHSSFGMQGTLVVE
jgi:plastocyanin